MNSSGRIVRHSVLLMIMTLIMILSRLAAAAPKAIRPDQPLRRSLPRKPPLRRRLTGAPNRFPNSGRSSKQRKLHLKPKICRPPKAGYGNAWPHAREF